VFFVSIMAVLKIFWYLTLVYVGGISPVTVEFSLEMLTKNTSMISWSCFDWTNLC